MHRLTDTNPLTAQFLVKGSVKLVEPKQENFPYLALMMTYARHNLNLSDPSQPAADVKKWVGDVRMYWYSLN